MSSYTNILQSLSRQYHARLEYVAATVKITRGVLSDLSIDLMGGIEDEFQALTTRLGNRTRITRRGNDG